MKRLGAGFLVLVLLMMQLMVSVQASDTEATAESETETANEIFNECICEYRQDLRKIVIRGTVKHAALITHKKYFLDVYRIFPGNGSTDFLSDSSLEPLASAELAVRFEFSLDVKSVGERFSQYVLVLRSPDGERTVVSELQYASCEDRYEYRADDSSTLKGLCSSETALGGSLNCGTAVIPLYLDQILNATSSGYMYSFFDRVIYLNKSYVENLDRQIRTYSSSGSRVYLQLSLSENFSSMATGAQRLEASHQMPNVFAEETLAQIGACVEFLTARYQSYQSGRFDGIIVGQAMASPLPEENFSSDLYAELYSLYLTVVACSARSTQPTADIVIPVRAESCTFQSESRLESVLALQDRTSSFVFHCGAMILLEQDSVLQSDVLERCVEYFSALRQKYQSAPLHSMVCWDVPSEMDETALCANYAYLYYKASGLPYVSSFVVSLAACESAGVQRLSELKPLMQAIDTEKSLEASAPFLSYFGVDAWNELIGGFSQPPYSAKPIFSLKESVSSSESWAGSFAYFDFSSGSLDGWFEGSDCTSIRAEYTSDGIRVLLGTVSVEPNRAGELMCLYEYPENIVHTPDVSFRLSVGDTENSLYRVTVSMGNSESQAVFQTILTGGEIHTLTLDLSAWPAEQTVRFIKIGVLQMEGSDTSVPVRVYEVVGHSKVDSSERLSEKIEADRRAVRNVTGTEVAEEDGGIWWIFGLIVLGIAVTLGFFLSFRREEDSEEADDSVSSEPFEKQ